MQSNPLGAIETLRSHDHRVDRERKGRNFDCGCCNPVCFISPAVLNLSRIEGPLEQNIQDMLNTIDLIRGTAAKMIGLVDDTTKAKRGVTPNPFAGDCE